MPVRGVGVPSRLGRRGAPAPATARKAGRGPLSCRNPHRSRRRQPPAGPVAGLAALENCYPRGEAGRWRVPGGDQAAGQGDRCGPRRPRPEPPAGRSDRTPDRLERVRERRAGPGGEAAEPAPHGRLRPAEVGRDAVVAGPRRPWPAKRDRRPPRWRAPGARPTPVLVSA
jgi:hypothetical protein